MHFVNAADQSCRLDLGCSSARRAPESYNNSSSSPQQSAGYALRVMSTGRGVKGGCGMCEHGPIESGMRRGGGDKLSHIFKDLSNHSRFMLAGGKGRRGMGGCAVK